MLGNAIETIVVSTKTMNTPSAAISSTVRGATGLRAFGNAVSPAIQKAPRGADDRDRQQADERDCRWDVEGDQPGERGEARCQQDRDERAADHGLVVRVREVRNEQSSNERHNR